MDGLDNLWVIGLELCDIGSGCLQVLFDLLKDHFEVLCIKGKRIVKCVLSLFAGLQHHYGHFVDEVYFLYQHPGHPRAN